MDSPKLFSLEEATALLPQIRVLVYKMQAAKHRADEAREEFEALNASNARGNGYDMRRETLAGKIVDYMKSVRQDLETLQEIGCELRDLEMGLIDFPSLRDGRVVNLCWKVEEDFINYWHSLDSGFADRKPL